MRKQILTFSLALLLAACGVHSAKQIPPQALEYKKVNFFAAGHKQIAFKAVGSMDGNALEGVLQVKKIGEDDFEVLLMTSGAYRVLHATVSEEGIAYRYLFKDVDNAFVRARITQFLNLLLLDIGTYERISTAKTQTTITYKNQFAKTKLHYRTGAVYPYAAQSIVTLNTADLAYDQYAPSSAQSDVEVPHLLVYRDGGVTLELSLISLR